jgi:hypothetical protein
MKPRERKVSLGRGGWWCRIDAPERSERMDRGPYWFRWMARMAFPIQRWTW